MKPYRRLHETIAAVCPITGVSVPTWGTAATVTIHFSPAATAVQQAAAQSALNSFDWSTTADNTWTGDVTPVEQTIVQQLNVLRTAAGLTALTLTQWKAAVLSNTPAVTTTPTKA